MVCHCLGTFVSLDFFFWTEVSIFKFHLLDAKDILFIQVVHICSSINVHITVVVSICIYMLGMLTAVVLSTFLLSFPASN